MSTKGIAEPRTSIINAVSDWLRLLALIVLAGETLLGVAYHFTGPTEPVRKYYFPLMIGFFALIVVGLFVDRALSGRRGNEHVALSPGISRQVFLVTRWYFKSGITEEELNLTLMGNKVTGMRRTRHPKGRETTYEVSGWHHTSTYWLEYHLSPDEYGGGSILLDEFTNDRLGGMVLSKDCDTGTIQCRANMWFPRDMRKNHKSDFYRFIGKLSPAELSGQPAQP